jgi:NAD+ synthase (glutamine-hydrolysing)
MRILLAQLNTTIADFEGNIRAIEQACDAGRRARADIILTPELAVLGYPPLDLLERREVLVACEAQATRLAEASHGLVLIVGVPLPTSNPLGASTGRPARNAAWVFQNGQLVGCVDKRLLPNYDVFDEERYFNNGETATVFDIGGRRVGITICEDIWSEDELGVRRYNVDPVRDLVDAGADCILNLSASPFDLGKAARRLKLVRTIAREHGVPVAYCNLVGGNDALIFDGRSFAVDANGVVLGVAAAFAPDQLVVDLPAARARSEGVTLQYTDEAPKNMSLSVAMEARAALVLGLRDYLRKCGFGSVVLGLSGGIDSALTAAIAVEALGSDAVMGVALPGPYSSDHSVADALELAKNLNIRCPVVPITKGYDAIVETLTVELARPGRDHAGVTLQNVQARLRGLILMGLSNHSGRLLLTTGNKSELAVGYCTLYGDMNGGLCVIGDLPKMLVYAVARTYNIGADVIPVGTLEKPPSAELAPDQRDDDTLPPYPILDAILDHYIINHSTAKSIADVMGIDLALVKRIIRLVELNEYKRRQAAPVLRVTRKAFGGGRRMPIARKLP